MDAASHPLVLSRCLPQTHPPTHLHDDLMCKRASERAVHVRRATAAAVTLTCLLLTVCTPSAASVRIVVAVAAAAEERHLSALAPVPI